MRSTKTCNKHRQPVSNEESCPTAAVYRSVSSAYGSKTFWSEVHRSQEMCRWNDPNHCSCYRASQPHRVQACQPEWRKISSGKSNFMYSKHQVMSQVFKKNNDDRVRNLVQSFAFFIIMSIQFLEEEKTEAVSHRKGKAGPTQNTPVLAKKEHMPLTWKKIMKVGAILMKKETYIERCQEKTSQLNTNHALKEKEDGRQVRGARPSRTRRNRNLIIRVGTAPHHPHHRLMMIKKPTS